MRENRTTASIGLAVALSLALGGAGGYLLGREHGADSTASSQCQEAVEAAERAAEGIDQAATEGDDSATHAMTIIDQNPECFGPDLRAKAKTYLGG
ncbi:hypothetical protein ACIOIM_29405 [Streptomyces albidoflavus]